MVGDGGLGELSDHEDHDELLRRRLRRMMMVVAAKVNVDPDSHFDVG